MKLYRSSGHTSPLPLYGVDGHSQQTPQDPYLSDAVLTRATALGYGFDDNDSTISITNFGGAYGHCYGHKGDSQALTIAYGWHRPSGAHLVTSPS